MNDRRSGRWWALVAITLAVLAASLDVTVLSVALPTLAGALKASESDLQWFSSGYALVLAAAMLPAGLLGDRYGRKTVLSGSLLLFGLGSLACAYAPTPAVFIGARLLVGLAGAGIIVMALSVMTVLFDAQERPRAVAIWGAANFLALPIGPLLGGWLLANAWWGWVFLLNVPIIAVAVLAVAVLVPQSRANPRPGIDVVGVLLSSGGLALLTFGLIEAGRTGWADAGTLGPSLAGVAVLVAFFGWEARLTARPGGQPLIDLHLFASPAFTWGAILVAIGGIAMIGVLFTLPQYFQAILGTDAQGSGLRLLPLIGGLVLAAILSRRLVVSVGIKIVVAIGFGLIAVAVFIGATTSVTSGDGFVAAWSFLAGAGMGFAFITAATGAVLELTDARAGVGAGLIQAVSKIGAPFGAAILGSVLASGYLSHLDLAGIPAPAAQTAGTSVFAGLAIAQQLGSATLAEAVRRAFVAGMDQALIVSGVIAVVGAVLAVAFLPSHAGAPEAAPESPEVGHGLAAHG